MKNFCVLLWITIRFRYVWRDGRLRCLYGKEWNGCICWVCENSKSSSERGFHMLTHNHQCEYKMMFNVLKPRLSIKKIIFSWFFFFFYFLNLVVFKYCILFGVNFFCSKLYWETFNLRSYCRFFFQFYYNHRGRHQCFCLFTYTIHNIYKKKCCCLYLL